MNYRGSYKKLLGNSNAAIMAAIEIYNKPTFMYRDECTVILLLNAWELMLKAILSKNKQSVFYPKKRNQPYRTLSWKEALSRSSNYFPRTVPHLPVQRNLEMLGIYRDNVVHFYNVSDFGVMLYALAQTSIMNYRDVLFEIFGIRLENRINWQLLPLGIRPPIDVVTYLAGQREPGSASAVRQFLSELMKVTEEVTQAEQDTGRLLTIFDVKLESVRKIGDADVVIGVDRDENGDGLLAISRIQDPNRSHPLRQTEILEQIDMLHDRRFTSYTFQAIVWKYNIKERRQYCWRASEGVLIKYSNDIITFIRNLTAADLQAALTDYREHQRRLRAN